MDDEFTNEDLHELRLMLSSMDEIIQLPESLKSKNLLRLLPAEEEKTRFNLLEWLISKKALPVYSVVAVAVLALMIVPNFSKENGSVPMEMATEATVNTSDGYVEDVESAMDTPEPDQGEPEMAMDEAGDILAEEPLSVEDETAGGTSQKAANYKGSINESEGLQDPEEAVTDMPERLGGDSPWNAGDAESGSSDAATPKAESQPAAAPPSQSAPMDDSVEDAPIPRAFGVLPADSSYYITDSGGYSFYWRTADTNKTEENTFAIILEVKVNDSDEKLYASHGITHFYRIDNVSVSDNRVAVFGAGDEGLGITMLQGMKSGNLKQESTEYLSGTFVGQHGANSYLYIFTSFADGTQVPTTTLLELPKSSGQGAFVITIADTAKGTFTKVGITKVPTMASYTFETGETIKVFYTNTDGDETSAVFKVVGTVVTLVP